MLKHAGSRLEDQFHILEDDEQNHGHSPPSYQKTLAALSPNMVSGNRSTSLDLLAANFNKLHIGASPPHRDSMDGPGCHTLSHHIAIQNDMEIENKAFLHDMDHAGLTSPPSPRTQAHIDSQVSRHRAATPLTMHNVPQNSSPFASSPLDAMADTFTRPNTIDIETSDSSLGSSQSHKVSQDQSSAALTDEPDSPGSIDFFADHVSGRFVHRKYSRTSTGQSSRIEDSVEALDKLEEQLDAINAETQVDRVSSPELVETSKTAKASSGLAKPKTRIAKSTISVGTVANKPSLSRLSAGRVSLGGQQDKQVKPRISTGLTSRKSLSQIQSSSRDQDKTLASHAPVRPTGAQPKSLQPPEPLKRSGKTPTVAAFELPGEAVARRLKEQREARLSTSPLKVSVGAAASPSTPSRSKSSKPLTVPSFKLPGEEISQRKREDHKKRLEQEEEAARQRRVFRARPVPSAGLKTPKSTGQSATTGQRASTSGQAEEAHSPASIGGQRTSISSDDLQLQKAELVKLARKEAAERSRQASRLWAQKQKQKQLAANAADN